MLSILFLILFLYELSYSQKIIANEYIGYMQIIQMKAIVGAPPKEVIRPINQMLSFSWFPSLFFDTDINNKIMELQIAFNYVNYHSYEIADKFCMYNDNKSYCIDKLFYYILEGDNRIKSENIGFGFAYYFPDEKNSIVHQLKAQGLIDHLSFALIPYNSKNKNGIIYFGGIPLMEEEKYKYKAVCKEAFNTVYWGSQLNKIIFNDYEYSVNNTVYFLSAKGNFIIPEDVMNELTNNTIVHQYFIDNRCELAIQTGRHFIKCSTQAYKEFYTQYIQLIYFVIDNNYFRFSFNELFTCVFDSCVSNFYSYDEMSSQWIFGNFFLYKYGVNFDYENNTITFLSNDPFVYQKPIKITNNIMKNLFVIISILVGILLIYNIIIKYKEEKTH